MNEIINAIPEYVITAVISTAIFYLMNAGKNLLHSKVQHAKTAQSKELWSFIEQVANTAVNSLVSKDITGDAKFAQATAIVQDALAKQGFTNVDVKAIESAVQAAYEKSDLTGNDTTDPVKVAIRTAPNRANDLTKEAD
ncbi:phage holin, LLH family [Limosilactobacillus portuensis]|uniref:phage holin, LLH family n=1 Tax=Limosilactobacillus portuensis TaxID=2742601 RepID=UPI003263C08F